VSDAITVLIVEDEALIAMELEAQLLDMGYVVMGPAHTLADAQRLTGERLPDVALLDANLAGTTTIALGASLASRGVAVGFCTGYGELDGLPPELVDAPILTKPVNEAGLQAGLKRLTCR